MPLSEIKNTASIILMETKTLTNEAASTPVSLYARFDRMMTFIIQDKDPYIGNVDGCVVSMYTHDMWNIHMFRLC